MRRAARGLTRLVIEKYAALRCGGRRGHAWVLVVSPGGLYLQCACGARSEGFELVLPRPK